MNNRKNELPEGNDDDNSSYRRYYRVCPECNKSFYGKNLRAVYCSDRCKVNAHRKKKLKSDTQTTSELAVIDSELTLLQTELTEKLQRAEDIRKELTQDEQTVQAWQAAVTKADAIYGQLAGRMAFLKAQHGTAINIAYPATKAIGGIGSLGLLSDQVNRKKVWPWFGVVIATLIANSFDEANNNDVTRYYDHSAEMAIINNQMVLLGRFALKGKLNEAQLRVDEKKTSLKNIEMAIERIKAAIDTVKRDRMKHQEAKPLEELQDEDGLLDFRDIDKVDFGSRLCLPGDIGTLLGRLVRHKLAITLCGEQGSGKTFLAFDLIAAFLRAGFKTVYLSIEEGVSDLAREKAIHYGLTDLGGKIAENATLEDVKRFAARFDVIVIDSWGKIGAEASDFDKLREEFPNTIFIAIFQQTTKGGIRGGSAPLFDASINIVTHKNNGQRYAICPKNRYAKPGTKYFIDDRMIKE